MKFTSRIILQTGLSDNVTTGPVDTTFQNYKELSRHYEIKDNEYDFPLSTYKWISIFGTPYKINNVLMIDHENDQPIFGVVRCILRNNENEFVFLCQYLITCCYESHYNAFAVMKADNKSLHLVKYFNISNHKPSHVIIDNWRQFIIYRN